MRDRAEIEADCREPSAICCATHARLLNDVPALLAALDEASMQRDLALRMHEVQFNRANRIEAERDRALAAVQRVEALCDATSARAWYQPLSIAAIRAALAPQDNGDSE
jgi:hypothetical protein